MDVPYARTPSGGASPAVGMPRRRACERTDGDRREVMGGGVRAESPGLAEEAVGQAHSARRSPGSGARVTGLHTPGIHAGAAHPAGPDPGPAADLTRPPSGVARPVAVRRRRRAPRPIRARAGGPSAPTAGARHASGGAAAGASDGYVPTRAGHRPGRGHRRSREEVREVIARWLEGVGRSPRHPAPVAGRRAGPLPDRESRARRAV